MSKLATIENRVPLATNLFLRNLRPGTFLSTLPIVSAVSRNLAPSSPYVALFISFFLLASQVLNSSSLITAC